ncbi:MAG: hypothetical protein ACOYXU_00400 [Nitrospirota bacterium]
MSIRPAAAARSVAPGVGDLVRMAAEQNPFLPRAVVLERTIVSERIGLLVGDAPDGMTMLYLWTHEDPGGLPWLVHLARWRSDYPAWRSAHGLPPCARPLRVIVAVPGTIIGVRDAVRLLIGSIAVVPYRCVDIEGNLVLGWDAVSLTEDQSGGDRVVEQAVVRTIDGVWSSSSDTLTPEEWAFFAPLKNR